MGMPSIEELKKGIKINNLTALSFQYKKNGHTYWLWRCDCGNEKVIGFNQMQKGRTKACGCKLKTHGMTNTVLYKKWSSLKARCYNKNLDSYSRYGGKGIKICEQWMKFEKFRNDMELSYWQHVFKYGQKNTTIDRIDSSKNYEPENCRWATYKLQAENRGINHLLRDCIAISPKGEVLKFRNQTIFAEKHGLNRPNIAQCLRGLIKKHKGWKFTYEEI